MKLVLPARIMDQVRTHGEETYPHECCGFLFGGQEDGTRVISQIRRQPNERTESQNNRFLITPGEFRDAERAARSAGLQHGGDLPFASGQPRAALGVRPRPRVAVVQLPDRIRGQGDGG